MGGGEVKATMPYAAPSGDGAATPTAIERTTHAIGRAEIVAHSNDVLILTYGLLVREAMTAREEHARH